MTTDELLRRRLLFTVGKGGVGRTTVTLALALEAARRGLRVLLVELEGAHGLEHALAAQRAAREPAPGLERIDAIVVDGRRALEEYLSLIIPVRRLLKTIFSSQVYQYFVAAAPGLKELMTVGKIWYEADRREREDGPAAPDIVLVDAPATGHSLQYLRMPQAALDAFPVGLVHREAERVVALLRDPARTGVVIVSTAEEMPANETAEIYAGLGEIGMPRTLLVLNQFHTPPCAADELEVLRAELDAPGAEGAPRRAAARDERRAFAREVLARAVEESGWAAINAENAERLAARVDVPIVKFPFLFSEEFGPGQVLRLSAELARQLDAAPSPIAAVRAGRGRRG